MTEHTPAVNSVPASPRSNLPMIILLLLLLGTFGTTSWLGWQYLQRMESHTNTLQQQLTAQLQLFETKNNQVRNLEQNKFIKTEKTLVQTQQQLENMQQTVQRLQKQQEQEQNPAYSKTHYHLLEADYMARLAAVNLSFGRNIPAALALLQAADQRIQEADNPGLNKIRQTLAENILSLQAIPSIDTAGLLSRLAALQEKINQLPLLGLTQPSPAPRSNSLPKIEEAHNESASDKRWVRALKESWVTLQKIIIIRQRDQQIAPLMAPEQETYLRQNLRLLLQQAQWAVIHSNAAIYQSSLQQAASWIQQYFANNEPATQAMLLALDALEKINIQPALPDMASTLQALNDALQRDKSGNTPVQKERTQ